MNHAHLATARCRTATLLRRPFASVCLPMVSVLAATLAWATLPASRVAAFVAESGPLETATAVLYGFALIAIPVAARFESGWKTPAALVVGSAGLLARELDLHRTATGDSVLRVSYYYGPAALQVKLITLAAIGLFLLALGHLTLRHAAPLLRGLKRAQPLAATVLVFFLTAVVAKAFDRGVGVLMEDFGIVLPVPVAVWAQSIEETLEACLPILIMLGAHQARADFELARSR